MIARVHLRFFSFLLFFYFSFLTDCITGRGVYWEGPSGSAWLGIFFDYRSTILHCTIYISLFLFSFFFLFIHSYPRYYYLFFLFVFPLFTIYVCVGERVKVNMRSGREGKYDPGRMQHVRVIPDYDLPAYTMHIQ